MLTQQRLKELLHYDPETGVFTWIKSLRAGWNGKQAGTLFSPPHARTSYLRVNLFRKNYLAHRLAFLYMKGSMPPRVDHYDCDGLNNRWVNLRKASHSQNISNATTKSNNSSGVKNVHWERSSNKWRGTFCTTLPCGKRKVFNVGLFSDIGEAAEAVRLKRIELHGEFARHE